MKILVTGANGLLGQKLVLQLSDKDEISLIATGRGSNRNPVGNYQYLSLDVTDLADVESKLLESKPDVIIHTAAMTQVDECESDRDGCWLQNVTAVDYLTSFAKQIDAFFIHLSTDFVFDGANGPYKEDDIPNPLSYYAESKLESENIVKESGVRWAIARTMLVYGIAHDMSRSNIILWVKKSLEEGKNIKVVNDQWRTPTLAEDLAKGCILLAEKQIEGIFHLSGKDLLTPYEMAIATAEYFQLDKSLIEEVDGSIFTQPAMRPPRTGFILDKASSLLGYRPVSFTEGIAKLSKQLIRE
jgi:dTDP-4-dehydrorhamnose reductase